MRARQNPRRREVLKFQKPRKEKAYHSILITTGVHQSAIETMVAVILMKNKTQRILN